MPTSIRCCLQCNTCYVDDLTILICKRHISWKRQCSGVCDAPISAHIDGADACSRLNDISIDLFQIVWELLISVKVMTSPETILRNNGFTPGLSNHESELRIWNAQSARFSRARGTLEQCVVGFWLPRGTHFRKTQHTTPTARKKRIYTTDIFSSIHWEGSSFICPSVWIFQTPIMFISVIRLDVLHNL